MDPVTPLRDVFEEPEVVVVVKDKWTSGVKSSVDTPVPLRDDGQSWGPRGPRDGPVRSSFRQAPGSVRVRDCPDEMSSGHKGKDGSGSSPVQRHRPSLGLVSDLALPWKRSVEPRYGRLAEPVEVKGKR